MAAPSSSTATKISRHHPRCRRPARRVQEIRNNQFGFAAGGPIIKNKTFFFLTGEVQLAVAGLSILETAPSAAWVAAGEAVLANYSVPVNQVSLNLLESVSRQRSHRPGDHE